MFKSTAFCLLVTLSAFTSGCAICCSPFDEAYSAYGGSWERHDMYHGRVGSAFAPAGGPVMIQEGEEITRPVTETDDEPVDEGFYDAAGDDNLDAET